jgi:hypothetical protein
MKKMCQETAAVIKYLWYLFNNKKTAIGAALLFLATALTKMAAIWNLNFDWITPMIETLEWIGLVFSGVGLGHKGVKAQKG